MLTLSRKKGQTIHIGNDIVITVSRTSTGQVGLAIKAPENLKILRGELLKDLQHADSLNSSDSRGRLDSVFGSPRAESA